ncbi:8-amino-7-oxononanoate synthase [Candidatus Roizmanbacteria bacterium RIFCSPLOWO2_02_FULL_37_19]|uniref:8-amino-7-oxononanoate synthase n=1 Tax=Candidatus Roizmanbacteria bacterium RIFCSPHIGHO2_02_FULL_37_24 TaxID=1802037 RepID=A0A1F7GW77_9BACT|nr:MAG: 8-amino-7-oxononanoate synthase [Candidatus Roizmanbacteria bacterium RIFCSPHIGHO2_01_FULL_38_41]OGK23123.1 MAG: 8-amino-7-oxononanoate synthase [Candidatus Roizmanbacteria bacterium RIFCSPHIGHO2_02_FULL_37_24]OGK32846.1 MAG: 8-amino-7-oxononanoate synthase [Candidatus Roizmanbacteria bacterium RIFCSPHIGHO2_12_FULL_37_23]OGK45477.1 MAG: 8-amino-7-oxononanoate synthase [Candidatus Roizmanbacteria bacterium RIFCSPLOWO2_01_FULL_37_57]OGK54259.1 MAG: 8-amino-7-oxononanoate synthase [Candida
MNTFYDNLKKKLKDTPRPRVIASEQGPYFVVDGKKKLNFCSSHYLGLAIDQRLKKAAKDAIDTYGLGTGYRTLAGTNVLNVALEDALAKFKRAEGAIVLPSGYLANMCAIQTILGKEDVIISDELNHASIIDAVRLSGVQNKLIYKHVDMKDLEVKLQEAQKIAGEPKSNGEPRLILIVTDGVFSMDGDLAPLTDIVNLAKQYEALTMVDDAHGEGLLGNGGRGIVDQFNVHGEVDIEVGTLSKAFSVIGGFITGKKELIDFYKQNARQFMFTSAMTAPDTAALLEAVTILQESDKLIKKLWTNTRYLKEELAKLGFDIGQSMTPITPIMLKDEELARKFAAELYERDVFASAIVFPMVAKGSARIRFIPSASHSKEDIDFALKEIESVGKKLQVIK